MGLSARISIQSACAWVERFNQLNQHEERMAELRQILQAIKDMLPRGNGH